MNFTDLQKKAQDFNETTQTHVLKNFEIVALAYIDNLMVIEGCSGKEFEYLLSDIIRKETKVDYRLKIGKNLYFSACEYAKNCIEIEISHEKVKPVRALDWTRNALHCFDHLVIHYINEELKETVMSSGKWFKETNNYEHLITKGGILADIGSNFKYIYQYRSKFEHIQYKNDSTGKIMIRNMSNSEKSKNYAMIISFFRIVLNQFDTLYQEISSKN